MNKIVCPKCGKPVEYEKNDIRIDERRLFLDRKAEIKRMVVCPCCRYEVHL